MVLFTCSVNGNYKLWSLVKNMYPTEIMGHRGHLYWKGH
jgi:hypothetical protein